MLHDPDYKNQDKKLTKLNVRIKSEINQTFLPHSNKTHL